MQHLLLAAALAAATVIPASAQEPPPLPQEKVPASAAAKPPLPLKLTVLLTRFQGDKKISSLPYTIGVLANGRQTSMRMGLTVPVPTTVFTTASKTDTAASTPMASYQYRDVGTNIDCEASDAGNGSYSLRITIEDSSIQADGGGASKVVRDAPLFRSFRASFSMLLRDGQTMQYVSVTDPLSGEVMRIDVTLALAK